MEENLNKRNIRKGMIFLLLSVLWMAVIFIFSSQTGDDSGKQSDFLASLVCKIIPAELSESGLDNLTFFIRKLAHFTEYAVLGILYYEMIYSFSENNSDRKQHKDEMQDINKAEHKNKHKPKIMVAIVIVMCMLYASSDEFHQSFTDGRSPSVRDVCIDTCGGAAGCMLTCFIINRKNKKKQAV